MKLDPIAIGQRITTARLKLGLKSPASLAALIVQKSEKKKGENKVNAETVRNWEAGKILPPWDKVDQLSNRLDIEADVLLFGDKREEQLRSARPHLELISPEEAELIELHRRTTPDGQKTILSTARGIQRDNAVPDATFRTINTARK